jgi:CRISPR-associated protein Csx10
MKKLYYTITTKEPLIITQHSDDPNMYETLQYIRGTVIQGLFAQKYIEKNELADTEFTRLIITGDCKFLNAYPFINGKLFVPAPLSIAKEKYNTNIVHNLLLSETEEQTHGLKSLVNIEGEVITTLIIPQAIHLHNAIDNKTRISKKGFIFNYQSLPVGIIFKGCITLRNDADENIIRALINNKSEIRIGRSATAEYGNASFNWDEDKKTEKIDDKKTKQGNVIMTLLSDTIIYDKNGLSSLNQIDLKKYITGTEIVKYISKKSRIEGFLNIWKLRKPSENVLAAGSSYMLDKLPDNEEELLNFGLGERTQEGFGQISFTLQNVNQQHFSYNEINFDEISSPPKIMPELSKAILQTVYYNRSKAKIIRAALNDAESTINQPNNHLLEKLKGFSLNLNSFRDNIDKLREPAERQLKKCHIGNQILKEHLDYRSSNIESVESLTQNIENTVIDLTQFKTRLTQLYFEQYFNQLRRKNKKQ